MDLDNPQLTWVNGQDVSGFTNWFSGQPITSNSRDNCGSLCNTNLI